MKNISIYAARLFVILTFIGLCSCAQVPKESVELSATVGRDLSEIQKSHIALATLYYDRLISDVNFFIDNTYAPYQIRETLSDNLWKNEMMDAIEIASQLDSTGEKQKVGFQKIQFFLQILNEEIEQYRNEMLRPIFVQKKQLLDNLSSSYSQIHYANSIVTGHLASVVKVHEAQNEILAQIDMNDLRQQLSVKTTGISNSMAELIDKANKQEAKAEELIGKFENIISNVNSK